MVGFSCALGKFSCLHFLCFNCETEDVEESSESCIQLLLSRLKHGHVINSRDLHGRSPLHIAVKWNNFGAVKQLVRTLFFLSSIFESLKTQLGRPSCFTLRFMFWFHQVNQRIEKYISSTKSTINYCTGFLR